MQHDHPIVIKKHPIGLVAILLVGLLLFAGLLFGMWEQVRTNGMGGLSMVLAFGAVVVIIGTAVQAYVYSLSDVILTDEFLKVANWSTLFSEGTAETEYRYIQDVDVQKPGIFAMVFDFGTLLIQTAGTERNLKLPLIPKVEYWRDELARRADVAKTPVQP